MLPPTRSFRDQGLSRLYCLPDSSSWRHKRGNYRDLYLSFVEGTDHPGKVGRRDTCRGLYSTVLGVASVNPGAPASVSRNGRRAGRRRPLGIWFLVHSRPYAAKLNDDGWSFSGRFRLSISGIGQHRITAYMVDTNASSLRLTQDLHFYVTPATPETRCFPSRRRHATIHCVARRDEINDEEPGMTQVRRHDFLYSLVAAALAGLSPAAVRAAVPDATRRVLWMRRAGSGGRGRRAFCRSTDERFTSQATDRSAG